MLHDHGSVTLLRYTSLMTSQRKMVGAHINDSNRDMWERFLSRAAACGLTASAALSAAAEIWLRDQGEWIFHDPAPGRMRLITPVVPGDFAPFEAPAEVAPHVDRWTGRIAVDHG